MILPNAKLVKQVKYAGQRVNGADRVASVYEMEIPAGNGLIETRLFGIPQAITGYEVVKRDVLGGLGGSNLVYRESGRRRLTNARPIAEILPSGKEVSMVSKPARRVLDESMTVKQIQAVLTEEGKAWKKSWNKTRLLALVK